MTDSTKINIRVRSCDLDIIDYAARAEGKTRSQFLRECAAATARRIIFSAAHGDGECQDRK